MKGGGTFRGWIDTARKVIGLPVTHHYADPVFIDPRTRKKNERTESAAVGGRIAIRGCAMCLRAILGRSPITISW